MLKKVVSEARDPSINSGNDFLANYCEARVFVCWHLSKKEFKDLSKTNCFDMFGTPGVIKADSACRNHNLIT